MAMNLERLRDRFLEIGEGDVARELDKTLQAHRESLPDWLPGTVSSEPNFFQHGRQRIPITQDVLEDPKYTKDLLKEVITPLGYRPSLDRQSLSAIKNFFGRLFMKYLEGKSLAEIMAMDDQQLLAMHELGKGRLELFRRATQVLKDKLEGSGSK